MPPKVSVVYEANSSVRKHFDKFLQQHYDVAATMETVAHEMISAQLLGKFATFLFMTLPKLKTAQSYLSQVKTFFLTKWSSTSEWQLHPHNTTDTWYSDIRAGLRKMYTNRAIATGEDLVTQAPPMYRDSLRQVASCLFFENTSAAMEDRDLLVLQWHCMGRASETGIRHQSIRYIAPPTGALQVMVGRSKTTTMQCIHAFCDADTWEADVFHALGCHLATSTCIDNEYHFTSASASVINKVLTRVFDQTNEITTKFQSHSGRRGCASEALSNSGVSVTEVIARGGWAFDAISRVFLYFSGVDRGDMRVGRAVAGWDNSDKGAVPPALTGFNEANLLLFKSFSCDLFRRAMAFYEESLLTTLAASLVMYYNSVSTAWQSRKANGPCLILESMHQSIERVGGNHAQLAIWSESIREKWLVSNLPWLRIENVDGLPQEVREKVTIGLHSFRETIERQVLAQHAHSVQLIRLQQMLESQCARMTSVEAKLDKLCAITENLSSQMAQKQSSHSSTNHTELTILPAPSASNTLSPFDEKPAPKLHPSSLKNFRASTVLVEFIANEWFNVVPSTKEKDLLRKIRLVALRVRDFLPASCLLTRPPSCTDPSFASWYRTLHNHALSAEKTMLEYLALVEPTGKKKQRTHLSAHAVNRELANKPTAPAILVANAPTALVCFEFPLQISNLHVTSIDIFNDFTCYLQDDCN
ncbi:hypothetical protein AeRB84_008401 [Aphanomyces euteiches]|nr:hypothetical protein AeRB84_008401 [Aphanomyces euteiches]